MNKVKNNKIIKYIEVTKQLSCFYCRAHFCNLINNLKDDQTH